jgi:hypothetical protein
MVFNRTQHLPPPSHTASVYTVLKFDTLTGKGGGIVEPIEKIKGQQFGKLGQKYQHD